MAFCTPVMKANLSSQIANQLEERIISQELKAGDKLPGEIELAEQFGTSRNILREAITTLKERGLVQVRNGSGAYVMQPDAQVLGDVVNRLVAVGSTSIQEVYELRVAIEVQSCGLAAVNATQEDLAALDDLIGQMERDYRDDQLWSKLDYNFHKELAVSTHKTLFPEFLRPLINTVCDLSDRHPRHFEARLRGIEQHKRIVEAVKSRDRAAAERAMEEHLQVFLADLAPDVPVINRNNALDSH